jgi:hypothetical protein
MARHQITYHYRARAVLDNVENSAYRPSVGEVLDFTRGGDASLLHQSFTAPQRFPGAAPNNPVLALSTGSTWSLDFSHCASTDVTAVLSPPPKITFPGKQRPT